MNIQIMHSWQRHLQLCLAGLHAYQVQALAAFSLAAATARHCHLSRLAAHVPSPSQPHSTRRRLLRLLGNERLDVTTACAQLATWLHRWNAPTARLHLLLDETPLRNDLRVLKISVAYRRRALPLVWCCYPLSGRAQPMPATVLALMQQAHHLITQYAPQAQVVLLADRGLCWPQLMTQCQQWQWHYLLRAQSQTKWRHFSHLRSTSSGHPFNPSARSGTLAELAQQPGQWWCGRAQVFQKAGWLECNVIACWPQGAKEAWLLVSSLEPTLHVCRWYARRIWQEQSFRDEKSYGFNWQASQVRQPRRVQRLLLILGLAQLWLMHLGQQARTPVWQSRLGLRGHCTRRLWSYFRTGWHLLLYALYNGLSVPCELTFTPP